MSCEERVKLNVCPECGSKLAVEDRFYNGAFVTIAICTGYPDCTFFYWSVDDSGGNPHSSSALEGLADWAIDESLDILRNELSPEEWGEALSFFEASPGEGGGAPD